LRSLGTSTMKKLTTQKWVIMKIPMLILSLDFKSLVRKQSSKTSTSFSIHRRFPLTFSILLRAVLLK
jgi:hypothetical protein